MLNEGMSERTSTCRAALDKWGGPAQMIVAIEELSELQKELCESLRGEDNKDHIAEEVADVLITVEQMKLLFDIQPQVDEFMEMKLRRLRQRLEE